MQGMLLMGIIYWYSKGIFNLINDYYRSEFQRKLKTDEPQSYRNTYDTDDIINLIQSENLNNLDKETNEIVKNIKDNKLLHDTGTPTQESTKLIDVCKKTNNIELLMYVIYEYSTQISTCIKFAKRSHNDVASINICDISEQWFCEF